MVIFALLVWATRSPAATIQNDVFWKDVAGDFLYSQSGTIMKVGGTYYWWGNKYRNAVFYAGDPAATRRSGGGFDAVTCYSSSDLVNWKFENNVLVPGTVPGSASAAWWGRIGVVYNANTKKYVLIMEYIPRDANNYGQELFATSNTPGGNFTFDHIQKTLVNVVKNSPGDQTVFTDDDGKAYLVFSSSHGRDHQYIAPLRAADFLNVEPATEIFKGPGREGNCMFKYKGRYYYCSSNLHGWNASPTYVISAAKIWGLMGPNR
jgi:beta-xylosidase